MLSLCCLRCNKLWKQKSRFKGLSVCRCSVFKERKSGKRVGDELLWYVSHNTAYWFLTGVINRICEAKLMKVIKDDKVHTTCTHWGGASWNVEFLLLYFQSCGLNSSISGLLGRNLTWEGTTVGLWCKNVLETVTEGPSWKEVTGWSRELAVGMGERCTWLVKPGAFIDLT